MFGTNRGIVRWVGPAVVLATAGAASAQFEPVGQGASLGGSPPGPGGYFVDRDAGISSSGGANEGRRRNNKGNGTTFTRLGKAATNEGALFHFDTAPVRAAIAAALAPFGATPEQARDAGALRVSFLPYLDVDADAAPENRDPPIAVETFLSSNEFAEGNGTSTAARNYTVPSVTYRFARDEPAGSASAPVAFADPDGTTAFSVDDLSTRVQNTARFEGLAAGTSGYVPLELDAAVYYQLIYGFDQDGDGDGDGLFNGNLRTFGLDDADNNTNFRQKEQNSSQAPKLFVELDASLIPEPSGAALALACLAVSSVRRRRTRA